MRKAVRHAAGPGCTWICSCRTSPPNTMHCATPGTESNRGLTVQSANVRNSIGESLSETRPIFSRSIVDEVSGDIFGVFTPGGQFAGGLAQLFGEHLARDEDVRAFLEHRGDDGQARRWIRSAAIPCCPGR